MRPLVAGRRDKQHNQRVGCLLGKRGIQFVQRLVFHREGCEARDVGQRNIDASAHHFASLCGGVVAGAKHNNAAVVGALARLVFVIAVQLRGRVAAQVDAADYEVVHVHRSHRSEDAHQAVGIGEDRGDERHKAVDVDHAGGEDAREHRRCQNRVELGRCHHINQSRHYVAEHKSLKFNGFAAVGHSSCLLADFDQRQCCVDIDGAAVYREGLVDGISQIVPFRRGGVGLVDGQVHTHNRDVVS